MVFPRGAAVPEPLRKALTLLSVVSPMRPLIGPVRVTVEVSTRCNFACLMCPIYSPLTGTSDRPRSGFMDMALAASVIDSAAKMRAQLVSFTGRGEPMLHPDFPGIVRMASHKGLDSEVFTNGSLLTTKRIEDLIEAGLGTLSVSLVGASQDSYARLHPGAPPGTFRQVLDALAFLQESKRRFGVTKPRLDLRFIGVEGNHDDIEKMVDLGIELRANGVHLAPLRNRSIGDIGSIAMTTADEKLAIDRLAELAPRAGKAGLKTNLHELMVFHRYGPISSRFPCYAGWFDARPLVDGKVEFCVRCRRIIGDIGERPLHEIWQDREYNVLRGCASRPAERAMIGKCDCDRCCHFYSNWRITRLLSALGLAPKIESLGNGHYSPESPIGEARSKEGDQTLTHV